MAKHETTVVLKAKDETGRALNSAERGMKQTERQANLLSGAIARAAGLLSIAAVGSIARGAFQSADELAKLSRQLGFSVERLQELKFAASQSGIQFNTLTMALQRFGRRSGEAVNGTGEAQDALKTLGIVLTDTQGNMRDVNDLFTEAINKLGQIENAAQRNALAMKLFDSEGVRLVRFGNNLESLSQTAQRELDIITQTQAENAERINDQFDQLQQKASTLAKTFVLDVAGGAEFAYSRILELTEGGRDFLASRENTGRKLLANLKETSGLLSKDLNPELEMAARSLERAATEEAAKLTRQMRDAAKQAEAFGKALEFASDEQEKIRQSIEGIDSIQEGRSGRPASVLGALTASSEARTELDKGNTTRAAQLALQAAEELRRVEQETGENVTNAEAFIQNFEKIAEEALRKSEKAQEALKLEITVGNETQTFGFSQEGVKQASDVTTKRIKEAARKVG